MWGVTLPEPENLLSMRLYSLRTPIVSRPAVQSPMPLVIPGDKSRVLVLFRLGENGEPWEVRAEGGSGAARADAVQAVNSWRLSPTALNGIPVQMYSGVVIQFGPDRNELIAPSARSAEEISPVLSNKCAQAIVRRVPEAISICGDARDRARKDKRVLPGEIATVEQEYGVALLWAGKNTEAKEAFDAALGAAQERLARHPAESAKILWARALASCQLGDAAAALADFRAAEGKFEEALQGLAGGIELSYRKQLEGVRASRGGCER